MKSLSTLPDPKLSLASDDMGRCLPFALAGT